LNPASLQARQQGLAATHEGRAIPVPGEIPGAVSFAPAGGGVPPETRGIETKPEGNETMKCIARNLMAAAFAVAMPLTAAHAGITELKFHVVQDQFAQMPTLTMRHDGEKWVWDNKGENFNIKVKVSIESRGNKFSGASIHVHNANMNLWQMPSGYKTRDFETLDTVVVGKPMLTKFQGDAANLCSVFGGEKKSVRDLDAAAVLSVNYNTDLVTKNGILPLKVVCMPVEPRRVPVALEVTQLKLYTIPARPRCGQPVKLITEIRTNKPGKVEFQLTRRDGEKQMASLTTDRVEGGYAARWAKTYKYEQSIRREYMVIVKGQPVSSDWVAVDVKCGAKEDHKRPGDLLN